MHVGAGFAAGQNDGKTAFAKRTSEQPNLRPNGTCRQVRFVASLTFFSLFDAWIFFFKARQGPKRPDICAGKNDPLLARGRLALFYFSFLKLTFPRLWMVLEHNSSQEDLKWNAFAV